MLVWRGESTCCTQRASGERNHSKSPINWSPWQRLPWGAEHLGPGWQEEIIYLEWSCGHKPAQPFSGLCTTALRSSTDRPLYLVLRGFLGATSSIVLDSELWAPNMHALWPPNLNTSRRRPRVIFTSPRATWNTQADDCSVSLGHGTDQSACSGHIAQPRRVCHCGREFLERFVTPA